MDKLLDSELWTEILRPLVIMLVGLCILYPLVQYLEKRKAARLKHKTK